MKTASHKNNDGKFEIFGGKHLSSFSPSKKIIEILSSLVCQLIVTLILEKQTRYIMIFRDFLNLFQIRNWKGVGVKNLPTS